MSNPEKPSLPDKDAAQFDSLNTDIVEPTDVVVDKTVRPIEDSLRKYLKLPPYDKPKPPQENPPK